MLPLESGAIVGLLDINQCMKDVLAQLERSDRVARKLASALGEEDMNDPLGKMVHRLFSIAPCRMIFRFLAQSDKSISRNFARKASCE